jgi:hypothetical protein
MNLKSIIASSLEYSEKKITIPNIKKTLHIFLSYPIFNKTILKVFKKHWIKSIDFISNYNFIFENEELMRDFLYELNNHQTLELLSKEEKIYFSNIVSDCLSYLQYSFNISNQYWIEKVKINMSNKVHTILSIQEITNNNILLFKYWIPFTIKNNTKIEKYNNIKEIDIYSLVQTMYLWADKLWVFEVMTSIWNIIIDDDWYILHDVEKGEIFSSLRNIEI